MPASTYQDRVSLLQAETERLTQYLSALPPEAWQQPSACGEWQVQDVVAHLVGVAEFYADNISRGLRGDAGPPPGRPPAGSVTAATSAAGVAQRAITARQQLGERLLATFKAKSDHLTQVLGGLQPEAQLVTCYHPGGLVPAQRFIDLRLKELGVHEWDIRSGLEPEVHLAPQSLPAIIRLIADAIASGSLRWAFRAGEKLDTPVRYRLEVTGAVPYQTDIVVTGDSVHQEASSASALTDVTLRCDTATFVLLIYGRLELETAISDNHITVIGDPAQANAFTHWFQGI